MDNRRLTPSPHKWSGLFKQIGPKPPVPVKKLARVSVETQKYSGVTWVDMQDPLEIDLVQIAKQYNLHITQTSHPHTRGQIAHMTAEKGYLHILLHFPYLMTRENRIAASQVNIFLGKDYLVTIHDSETPMLRTFFSRYPDEFGDEVKSPGRILFRLIEYLLKDVQSLLDGISAELDEIDANVFDSRDSDAQQIGQLRQKIMKLRRTLATQKNVLDELDTAIDKFTSEHLERYYRANTNMSRKLWETVEEARETVEIYKDADFTTSTERTNRILAVLTLLFTLTIPATVIGTFYGMNVTLPGGLTTGSWQFFGPYTMLKLISGVSLAAAVVMYVYFKRKRWF